MVGHADASFGEEKNQKIHKTERERRGKQEIICRFKLKLFGINIQQ